MSENLDYLYHAMVDADLDVEWYRDPMDSTPQIKWWTTPEHEFYRLFAEAVDECGTDYPGFNSCLYEVMPESRDDCYAGTERYFVNVRHCLDYARFVQSFK